MVEILTEFVSSIYELLIELETIGEWQWKKPVGFLILVFAFLALLKPSRARAVLNHSETWLFEVSRLERLAEGVWRSIGLLLVFIFLGSLALYFAHPERLRIAKEPAENLPAIFQVTDVSGSMSCATYQSVQENHLYFLSLAEKKQRENLGDPVLAIGIYYFSSYNLLEVSPITNYERLRNIVKRFLPGCMGGGGGAGIFGRGRGRQSVSPSVQGYGAGGGTEPGPSLWQAMLDAVSSADPGLVPYLKTIRNQGALAVDLGATLPPLETFFEDEELIERFCESSRGKRIVLLTDSHFSMNSPTSLVSVSRVLELARVICLPVDLVTTGHGSAFKEGLPNYIQETGGGVFSAVRGVFSTQGSELAARMVVQRAIEDSPPIQERSRYIKDDRPRLTLLALALTALVCWGVIRLLRIVSGF